MTLKDIGVTPKGKPRAIVLGLRHPRGLAVVRSLARAGVVVDAVDHKPFAPGLYSRYLRNKYLVSADAERAVDALESLGQDERGVLIPTSDDYLKLVAKNFDRLSHYFIMSSPPWSLLNKMNRPSCYNIAHKAGIKTPPFFTPKDDELKEIVSGLDFKAHSYILKTYKHISGPADARTGRFTRDAGPDAVSLLERSREMKSRTGTFPMIQEIVPGEADSCIGVTMVVDRDHEPVLAYCVRRLNLFLYSRGEFVHPYEIGANVHCESVHNDEAVEAAKRFVRHAKYFGIVTVEFRRDVTDGTLNLINVDATPQFSTSLSTALGLDTPTALYQVVTGEKVNIVSEYPNGVAWVSLMLWSEALWVNRRYGQTRKQLLTMLRSCHRIKAFAYLDSEDPKPFVADLRRQGLRWLRALQRRRLVPQSVARWLIKRTLTERAVPPGLQYQYSHQTWD